MPRVTFEQWLVLQTVVEEGGFAKAAEKLHRTQSSISYQVSKLQEQLGIDLLETIGRKAVLTEAGKIILNQSKRLLRTASDLEQSAKDIQQGWESELRLYVDEIFPNALLYKALEQFKHQNQRTRLIIQEGILSGPTEALTAGNADLVIASEVPTGFIGSLLFEVESVACASIHNPLHTLPGPLTEADLFNERYIVVRDSGNQKERNEGWLGSEKQWKVSSMKLKWDLIRHNLGFSWLPKHLIEASQGEIKPLQLKEGGLRKIPLYLILRDSESPGPACKQLSSIIASSKIQEYLESPFG